MGNFFSGSPVKNTTNEDVEATVTGGDEQLQEFITWCRNGPEGAKVKDVIITKKPKTPFIDFEIVRG